TDKREEPGRKRPSVASRRNGWPACETCSLVTSTPASRDRWPSLGPRRRPWCRRCSRPSWPSPPRHRHRDYLGTGQGIWRGDAPGRSAALAIPASRSNRRAPGRQLGRRPCPPREGSPMAENKPLVVYAAAYETVEAALADLNAIEQLHKDQLIGQYDAAVIDREDGKAHVVKRMDRPRIRVIPQGFGGAALPRKELNEAAEELTASQAGLIAVGEPTIEQGLDKALTGAARVVKRAVNATPDEITSELEEALKEADVVDMHLEVDIIPVSD